LPCFSAVTDRQIGSNPGYTTLELSHHLRISKAKVLITAPELIKKVGVSAQEVGLPSSSILLFDVQDQLSQEASGGYASWRSLLQHGEEDWLSFEGEEKAKTTVAALLSTSGTTGLPKAAMISHYSCVMQNIVAYDSGEKPYEVGRAILPLSALKIGDIDHAQVSRLICLPMFHAFAGPISHVAPIREGHTTYVMSRFDMSKFCHLVSDLKITETAMVPPMMIGILMSEFSKQYLLKSLEVVWCGGAPLDASIMNQMYEQLAPKAIISQVWGMTEACWITTMKWPERDTTGSVGRLLPNTEAK
jgi:4-coumarate--CoA ligase